MAEYIDRDAFLAKMKKTDRYFMVRYDIEEMPAADVEPVRHGRWIEQDEESDWLCANCGSAVCICVCGKDRTKKMSFCPVCGARMDGGADNR